jgi:NitT/TauT family transport system substrate-binding protein
MKLSLTSYLSLLSCLLLVGLSLASCGGETTSTTNSASMTLKVAVVNKSIFFFPFYVAQEENFIKDQGLTLDPSPVPLLGSGSKLALALEANSIDVAVGGLTDVFTISRIDAQIKIIGAVTNDYLLDVIVSKQFEQQTHLTEASPLADKVKALVGKKVGISAPNSASDALITYLFRQQGLDSQKDVTKVNVGAALGPDLAALQANRVDAVITSSPAGEEAEVRGFGDSFISPVQGDVPSMTGQLFGVLYAKQSVIDAKPKAVQAFIRAIAQAETFIQKNPDKVAALLGKYLGLDQKSLNLAWSHAKASMPQTPQIDQQAYETANQFHVKAGLIAVPLAYNNLVATDTINKALNGMSSSS